jgi:hypothetical protein
MKIIRFFRGAGATGQVFLVKNGKVSNKGIAYSSLIGPQTIIAVVPTTPQVIPFSVDAITSDNQKVLIAGDIEVDLIVETAVKKFDFTVEINGSHSGDWVETLNALVVKEVLEPAQSKAKTLTIEVARKSHKEFSDAITVGMSATNISLSGKGVTVKSCSVSKVVVNEEINTALGSKEKEVILTNADTARHTRQMKAAENVRKVQEYEIETLKTVESKRTELIKAQSANKQSEADADAKATEKRLEAFEKVASGKLIGAALLRFAESGKVQNLHISPELVGLIQEMNKN